MNPEKSTVKKIILIIVHLFITISTIILTAKGVFFGASKGQLGENMINLGYFKAFTIDSNDLAALSSLFMAICLIISLYKKDFKIPYWTVLLQFMSAVSLGLTFITTAVFLAPTQVSIGNSYWLYFIGDMFFLHFLTPVLTMGAYIFGEDEFKLKLKENFMGIIPMLIYAVVYLINAVILKTWSDFYGFTFGGHNWAIVPVITVVLIVTFGIGTLLILARKLRK